MLISVKKNQHNLKSVRRFEEDIWGRFSFSNKSSQVLKYLYEAHQNNYLYKDLLKKRFWFLIRKRKKFYYQVVTDEKEFKKKKRTLKMKHYLNMLKLRRFYGNLKKRNFKRLFQDQGLTDKFLNFSFSFFLESRIDVLLYRANFFASIFTARQFLNHKKVFVNGLIQNKPKVKLYLMDMITVSNYLYFYSSLKKRLEDGKIFVNYPRYLEVNYKVGLIIMWKIPSAEEVPFPFFMKLQTLSTSFVK